MALVNVNPLVLRCDGCGVAIASYRPDCGLTTTGRVLCGACQRASLALPPSGWTEA